MKKKWFRDLSLANEEYLMEAAPGQDNARKKNNRRVISVLASAACLAVVLSSVWLFRPYSTTPPSVKKYESSEYYPVIEKLSVLTWEKPKYKNHFDKLASNLTGLFKAGAKGDAMMENAAPGDPGEDIFSGLLDGAMPEGTTSSGTLDDGGSDMEITDNQVVGVTEGDRIKRTGKHIYYLDENNTLRVYSIEGMDSKEISSLPLLNGTKNYYVNQWELYLSADGKTVTVMAMYGKQTPTVCVLSLDVSDHANITEKNRLEITGNYLSSRVTGGKILLMTQFAFNKSTIDFDKAETFLPQVNGQCMDIANIVIPEEANATRYTVVMKLDENTLATEGQAAFLSYSEDVYVNHDRIYLANVFADVQDGEDGGTVRNSMTEITCLSYKDGFEKKGTVTVRGYVKDQWSMDEYEGIFRVVTTTNATKIRETNYGYYTSADVLVTATGNSNASLYCVDVNTFEVVASVEDFAPPYEEVQSVRFDGNTAYVCTSVEMSDPVFFFDLSDLNNITYKDTGTIEGFSSSLVDFGDGYLLGIGREDWDTFKAEIYYETDKGVESFCSYTTKASYSTEYKSYYIDRENRLLGLGLTMQKGGVSRYVVLRFDGYNLIEVANVELAGNNSFKRGVYIDGFMYMFGAEDFKVDDLSGNFNGKTIAKITDRAKEENIPCDTALEKFYEDDKYEYYFGCIKSQYVDVVYQDGHRENIKTALEAGIVKIADLDRFKIEYYTKAAK